MPASRRAVPRLASARDRACIFARDDIPFRVGWGGAGSLILSHSACKVGPQAACAEPRRCLRFAPFAGATLGKTRPLVWTSHLCHPGESKACPGAVDRNQNPAASATRYSPPPRYRKNERYKARSPWGQIHPPAKAGEGGHPFVRWLVSNSIRVLHPHLWIRHDADVCKASYARPPRECIFKMASKFPRGRGLGMRTVSS